MLKKNLALLIVCSLLVMTMVLVFKPAYSAGATIFVDPVSTTAIVGHDYTVYIKVEGVADLYAYEFQLNYDKNKIDLTFADLVAGGLNTPVQVFQNVTDEVTGHLWFAVSTTYPTLTGVNHTTAGAIFEMHFHAITAGNSTLHLSGAILSDSTGTAYTPLTTTDGSIDVYNLDLTVTNITIDDLGCQLYKNDMDSAGNPYYYPVEVTVHNTGGLAAGAFHVRLEVYYVTGSSLEAQQEIALGGLAASADVVVNFTTLFHPTNTRYYRLTAIADSQNEVVEDNEANNQLVQDNIPVTVYGDVNGDHVVNILDGVRISLAWGATPSDGWWNIKADLDHNGVINILDATRASLHWGETW